jgi:segregation and condensation protein B
LEIEKSIAALEAILFASGEPLSLERLAEAMEIEKETIERLCAQLGDRLEEQCSGIKLIRMDEKFQLVTRDEHNELIRRTLDMRRNTPLSPAAMEVLAVVAYNQPVTKGFVEQVRGVDCSGVINSLVVKGLLEERGRLELPGRPLLYGTSPAFLRCFKIESLEELPQLPAQGEPGEDRHIEEFIETGE